jgi:hypothetical protein
MLCNDFFRKPMRKTFFPGVLDRWQHIQARASLEEILLRTEKQSSRHKPSKPLHCGDSNNFLVQSGNGKQARSRDFFRN